MKLVAFLNQGPVQYMGGYANGYVAVPPGHPYYGVNEDNIPVDVHGGLTFGAKADDFSFCPEFIYGDTIPDDWWVFGFDTLHWGDYKEYWSRERCIAETIRLKEQLEQLANNNLN